MSKPRLDFIDGCNLLAVLICPALGVSIHNRGYVLGGLLLGILGLASLVLHIIRIRGKLKRT